MKVLLVFSMIFLFLACKKGENQKANVQFEFQTYSGDNPYLFSTYFTNGDGINIRMEVIQFYVSNIRFVSKKGKEIEVAEIALVKCTNEGIGSCAVKIPAGEYTTLRFGIGVPEEMNLKGPAEFTEVNHPLNASQNTYWGMNGMYRFVMMDGKYDLSGDGIDEGGFSYHTGFKDCYREVELKHDFSFDRKEEVTSVIRLDLNKLFYVSGSMIDIPVESNFHGDYSNIALAIKLSDNFANALSIQ